MLFFWTRLPSNGLRRVEGLWEGRAGLLDTPYEAGSSSVPLLMKWPSNPCFLPPQEMGKASDKAKCEYIVRAQHHVGGPLPFAFSPCVTRSAEVHENLGVLFVDS